MTTVILLTMGVYLINLQSCWLIYALLLRAIAQIRFNTTSWTYSYIMHRRYRSTLISVMASLASWLSSAHFGNQSLLDIENRSQLFQVHMNMMFIFSLPYTTKEAFAWGKQYCRYTLQYWTMAMKHVMKEKPYAWMLMLCPSTVIYPIKIREFDMVILVLYNFHFKNITVMLPISWRIFEAIPKQAPID